MDNVQQFISHSLPVQNFFLLFVLLMESNSLISSLYLLTKLKKFFIFSRPQSSKKFFGPSKFFFDTHAFFSTMIGVRATATNKINTQKVSTEPTGIPSAVGKIKIPAVNCCNRIVAVFCSNLVALLMMIPPITF